jgi:hypothetical protein
VVSINEGTLLKLYGLWWKILFSWWIFWTFSDITWQWPVLRVQKIHCRMHTSQRTWMWMFGEWVLSMILFVCFYMCSNVVHLPQWQELKSSYNWVCQSECTACRCCISKCPCQTFVIFLGWDCATEMCSMFASSMFSLHWTHYLRGWSELGTPRIGMSLLHETLQSLCPNCTGLTLQKRSPAGHGPKQLWPHHQEPVLPGDGLEWVGFFVSARCFFFILMRVAGMEFVARPS